MNPHEPKPFAQKLFAPSLRERRKRCRNLEWHGPTIEPWFTDEVEDDMEDEDKKVMRMMLIHGENYGDYFT